MATQGTPIGGLSEIQRRTYVIGDTLALVAYRNPANSLGPSTIMSDIVQPAFANGYSPIPLNGSWSVVNGLAMYVHPGGGDPVWTVGASWGAALVIGIAVVYGSVVMHFKDLVAAFDPTVVGAKLSINISSLVNNSN